MSQGVFEFSEWNPSAMVCDLRTMLHCIFLQALSLVGKSLPQEIKRFECPIKVWFVAEVAVELGATKDTFSIGAKHQKEEQLKLVNTPLRC